MTEEIRKRYDDARSAWGDWRARALEDLNFSNPAAPKQWADEVINARGRSRPALVFDQTNQYIGQVVNDARQNKPSIDILPGDSEASDEAAEAYGGLIRQIEYASRAQIAYDTAIEYAARIGLGFFMVVPELVDPATNDHDIRIKAIVDPLAVTFDPDSIEPDGQDADCAWVETRMSEAAFKRRWKKAKPMKTGDRFYDGKSVTVCQYFERSYTSSNRIIGTDGKEYGEDDYHQARKTNDNLDFHDNFIQQVPKVVWSWWNGEEVLEQTDYPAPYVGIVPVYGNVLWVDGKRQVCGMTRRMMDSCKAYNYARSAEIEAAALMPKAPWVAPAAAIGKYQSIWDASNRENRSVLPYEHKDASGEVLPAPTRQDPPQLGSAFPMLSQQALQDVQASVGMFKSSLGQNSNAKTGVAIGRLQQEGDTATFHYIDNLNRSVEQGGRLCVALLPSYYDREKVARILKVDGKPQAVKINPGLKTPHQNGDILQVNPKVGAYDVRVKAGPSYTTMRQEMADKLVQLGQSNPPLAAALSPLVLQMADMPGADKAIKVAMALLPPEVRAAYDDEQGGQQAQIPPEVVQEVQQMGMAMQELQGALKEAQARVQELEADAVGKHNEQLIKAYDAETKRIQALNTGMMPEQVQALAMQTVLQALQTPAPSAEMIPQEPASAGFFMPEEGQVPPPEMAATGANPGLA